MGGRGLGARLVVGVGDERAVVGDAGFLQGGAVSGEAFAAGVQLDGQVADESDAAVPVGDQMGDTVLGPGTVGADNAVSVGRYGTRFPRRIALPRHLCLSKVT
ncbi:hypothetical protein GCM10011428_07960 [Streptomyces violaceus]